MEGLDALVEGLDDSFWDAVPSPAASPVKPKPPPRSVSDADSATRCTVDSVSDSHLNGRWCKVLHAHVSKDHSSPRTIYLFDDWYETPVHPGDTINVLGAFSSTSPPSIEITSQSNLVILHPDILLTATSLSNAPQCPRKPLLSSLVRASNDTSPALVWGNMLHELIQRCLLHPDPQLAFSPSFINGQIDSIIVSSLGSLVVLDISEETARATLRDRARALSSFASRYIGSTPKPEATLSDTRSTSSSKTNLLAISRIHEVEEDIWSPKYGLKGKLDVTVEAVITESSSPPGRPGMAGKPGFFGKGTLPSMLGNGIGPTTSGPRPFEIKTGRSMGGMEHRAQTMLYTLLASERYGVEVDKGLLFYTQKDTGEIVQVPRGRNEIRGLLIMRNELANWMMVRMRDSATDPAQLPAPDDSMQVDTDIACGTAEPDLEEAFLPPPIDSDHTCKRCYVLDACTLYRFALSTPSPSSTSSKSLIPTPTFKALESPPPSSTHSTLSTTYAMKTSHLNPSHALFFRTWERLLSLEEKDLVRYKSELWRVGAVEREKRGRCLSGMVMKQDLKHPNSGATSTSQSATVGELDLHSENDANQVTGSRIHKFTYTFTRAKSFVFPSSQPSSQFFPFSTSQPSSQPASQHPSQTPPPTLLHTHLSPGDAITISIEPYLLALVQGYILSLTADEITVGVDHVLDLDALKERVNVLKARRGGSPSTRSTPASWNLDPFSSQVRLNTNGETNGDEEELIFRIDKDELFGGMSRMRNNLAQLFYVEGDHKRRSLIVDLREPVFGPVPVIPGLPFPSTSSTSSSPPPPSPPSPPSPPTPPSTAASIQQATSTLNPTQLSALHKVLSAQDYALILGMPGTGKTTVIAALIRVLVALGKTVLLASYTHSAVDSILRKLSESEEDEEKGQVTEEGKGRANEKRKNSGFWDVKVLRLGNIDKVHPDARRYTLEARPKAQTVAGLEKQWLSPPVVASTCLGVDHPIFTKRKFDYCIVDEASQITLPTCLGPLRHADKFVLVGDHFQLPPLVKNPQARTGGLDVSLFRLLSSAHPQSVTDLTHQYRMNASIMLLSNKLIYDDRLKCGSESVAGRRLELPDGGMAVRRMHRRLGRMRRVQGLGEPGDDRLCNGKNENGCWLSKLLDPSTKAIFVDTSTLGSVAYDSRVGDLVQNTTEASLVVQFVEALVKSGVRQDQVGVISLYRQQVKLLGEKLKNVRGSGHEGGVGTGGGLDGVEVLTADKSQGRDKDCIVVSLVRSNPENQVRYPPSYPSQYVT
ncbi:DNA replication helicase dna2, variant 2 [Coprinopsis cinerea AmutBmut pab1-1]|nr:DNA replication helicase dna2, variant 2 [Coprinopsis cinerea AmutBmut pab1-1]